MTKVLRYYLLWFLSTAFCNHGIPFLAKNKRRKNRFREGFRIIPKYERRNSEKYRMQLNRSFEKEGGQSKSHRLMTKRGGPSLNSV